jgi:hypothetical protein
MKDSNDIIQFCQKCLRKYIPQGDESLCLACMTIPTGSKKTNRLAAVRRRKAKLVGDIEEGSVMPLKEMCIKVGCRQIVIIRLTSHALSIDYCQPH